MVADRDTFRRQGFWGPEKLLTAAQCALILRHAESLPPEPPEWPKSWAAADRLFFDVATRPALLSHLKALLGEDIVLWGASIVRRGPGEAHPWHTDIESAAPDGRFVSAWIGLANTHPQFSLRLVAGSHRIGRPLQLEMHELGLRRGEVSDAEVLAMARRRDPACEIRCPAARDGDVVLFDGRIWHGSHNLADAGPRTALLLQYAAADQPVIRLDSSQLSWPFKMLTMPRPPVIAVAGTASEGINRLVAPPALPDPGTDVLTVVRQLDLPLTPDPGRGWKAYPIFRGPTPVVDRMSCHAAVLSPGRSPHPPHGHGDEEILILLDGEARLVVARGEEDAEPRVETATPGSFAYYPAYLRHTIRNEGTAPATYLTFRWRAAPAEAEEPLPARVVPADRSPVRTKPPAYEARLLLESPTSYLGKLHVHLTTLQSGAGYEPHRDDHDGAIVILSGQVECMGQPLGPGGIIYRAAGQLHGLRSIGGEPARYLVFEFHAPAGVRPPRLPEVEGLAPLPASMAGPSSAGRLAGARRWICRKSGSAPAADAALVDRAWYLSKNPDVAAAGADPLTHYRQFGGGEGRAPAPPPTGSELFDGAWYLKQNPDVAADGADPLEHYLLFGAAEGRRARACFDSAWYVARNPAALDDVNALVHYAREGAARGRSPHPGAMPDGSAQPLHESIDWAAAPDVRMSIAAYLAARGAGTGRVAVCTAIFGGHDSLMLPEWLDPAIDYVCFSDEAWEGHGVWKVCGAPYRHADPVRMARYAKTHLDELLPSYRAIIWIDANVLIRGDLMQYVDALQQQDADLGAVTHPYRRCVYQEARVCKWDGKDSAERIEPQMERYRRAGVPRDAGLFENNFMIFRPGRPGMGDFLRLWWREIEDGSRRDQLSLGWALRQTGLKIASLLPPGQSVRDNADFALFPHERDSPPPG